MTPPGSCSFTVTQTDSSRQEAELCSRCLMRHRWTWGSVNKQPAVGFTCTKEETNQHENKQSFCQTNYLHSQTPTHNKLTDSAHTIRLHPNLFSGRWGQNTCRWVAAEVFKIKQMNSRTVPVSTFSNTELQVPWSFAAVSHAQLQVQHGGGAPAVLATGEGNSVQTDSRALMTERKTEMLSGSRRLINNQ